MRKKAQSTLEYAVIIAVAAAALFAMGVYMKRSVQGKLRATDELSGGNAYSPRATTSISTTTRSVAESSHSYTELDSTAGGDIDETNITESTAGIEQATRRQESILPLASEPVR